MKKFYILLLLIFVISTSVPMTAQKQGQEKIDSLLAELPKSKPDTNKVNLLSILSYQNYSISPNKGVEYGMMGLKLANELNWNKGIANCYNSLGMNNMSLGNYPKSLNYYERSLKIKKEIGNNRAITGTLTNIGTVYARLSIYEKALDYYQKALKIDEEIGDKGSIAKNLSGIGIVYQRLSNYAQALEYFQEALKIDKDLGNKENIARHFSNIGNIFNDQSDLKQALKYYHKALKLNEEIGYKSGMAINLGNIGNANNNLPDYEKAMKYYENALKLNKEIGRQSGVAANLGNIGALYFSLTQDSVISKLDRKSFTINLEKQLNLDRSLKYSLEAVEIAKEIGYKLALIEFYYNIQKIYYEKENYKKSHEYLGIWAAVKDSVFTENKSVEIGKLEAQYEFYKKERNDNIVAAKETEIKSFRNTLQNLGIFIFIILLVVTMFIIRRYNIRPDLVDAAVFFVFLLFYEFVTVLIEPWADEITNQESLYKLGINIAIALLLIPLSKLEYKVRSRFVSK